MEEKGIQIKVADLLLVALLISSLTTSISYWDTTIQDDAFITYRYSENFAEGMGLVYNEGERVEGYTNFLWTLILGIGSFLGISVISLSQILGILASLGVLLLTYLISYEMIKKKSLLNLIAPSFLAFNSGFLLETMGGIETIFFSFWIVLGAYMYIREFNLKKNIPYSSIAFGLSALSRPEGLFVMGLTFLHSAIYTYKVHKTINIKKEILRLGIFGSIFLPFFAWRLAYYGHMLPNTFYAKTGGGSAHIAKGFQYIFSYFKTIGFFIPLIALIAFLRRGFYLTYIAAILVPYLAYLVSVGGDFKPTFRFLVIVSPFLYLLFQEGIRNISLILERKNILTSFAMFTIFIFAIIILITSSASVSESTKNFPLGRYKDWQEGKIIGEWLKENHPHSTIALGTAGIIPYYSKVHTIDMFGLNDAHIARTEIKSEYEWVGHEKMDAKYVISKEPDFIFFMGTKFTDVEVDEEHVEYFSRFGEVELWSEPSFLENYELASTTLDEGVVNYFRRK